MSDLSSPEPVDVTPVGRALDAEAAADRRRRRWSSALGIALAFVLAVARALRRTSSACSASHLVLAFADVPGLDRLVLAEQAVPGPGGRAADRGVPPDRQRLARQRRRDRRRRLRPPVQGAVPAVDPVACSVFVAAAAWSSSGRSPGGSSPRCAGPATICRPVLIVGTDADAVGLLHAAQRTPDLGYRVVGFVGPDDIGVRGGVHGARRRSTRPRRCSRRPAPPAC